MGKYIVEFKTGHASPNAMTLEDGTRLGPLAVGRVGAWAVEVEGIADVHGFVYFDGKALFVRSEKADVPVKQNGNPVGVRWTEVSLPSTIAFAGARMIFRKLGTDEAADAGPEKPVQDERTRLGPSANDSVRGKEIEDRTRLGPSALAAPPETNFDEQTRIAPAAAPARKSSSPPPATSPAPSPAGRPSSGHPAGHSAAAKKHSRSSPPAAGTNEKPRQISVIAIIAASMIVIVLPLIAIKLFRAREPVDEREDIPSPTLALSNSPPPAPPALVPAQPSATLVPTSVTPNALPTVAQTRDPQGLERAAVDAIASGSYERAATIYEALAAAHPESPAFAEAARILRARLDASTP